MTSLPFIDSETVFDVLTWERAITGVEAALAGDVDPEDDGPRLFADNPLGEWLIMPTHTKGALGVKILTVSPENPERGLEKIQGTYLLFDADTAGPKAIIEGTSLTTIRTSAVTTVGLRALAKAAPAGGELPDNPRIVIFGVGTQGVHHALAAQWAWPKATFELIGRRPERVQAAIEKLATHGLTASDAGADPEAAVSQADIVITTTTSATPVLEGAWIKPNALVASIGMHGLDARELPADLILRSDVLLESRGGMFREGGNITLSLIHI